MFDNTVTIYYKSTFSILTMYKMWVADNKYLHKIPLTCTLKAPQIVHAYLPFIINKPMGITLGILVVPRLVDITLFKNSNWVTDPLLNTIPSLLLPEIKKKIMIII